MMLSRRSFCALLIAAQPSVASARYADRDLIVHLRLPRGDRSYDVGQIVYDPGCSRHFRLVKLLETRDGLLGKLRWVSCTA